METKDKLKDQICRVSREGVCLMDFGDVLEVAKRKGLYLLAETIEMDWANKAYESGEYISTLLEMKVIVRGVFEQ